MTVSAKEYAKYENLIANNILKEIPNPDDPVGYNTVNTYKAALYNVWQMQASGGSNSLSWDLIFMSSSQQLLDLVKARRKPISWKTYAEKLGGNFTPFMTMAQVDNIEKEFWNHAKGTVTQCFPALQNRFTFLLCYSAILRHESLFLGELSNMFGFEHN